MCKLSCYRLYDNLYFYGDPKKIILLNIFDRFLYRHAVILKVAFIAILNFRICGPFFIGFIRIKVIYVFHGNFKLRTIFHEGPHKIV